MSVIKHLTYKNFYEVKHPLIQHKLSLMRDVNTPRKLFKELMNEITLLLVYEASRSLQTITKTIDTPESKNYTAPFLADDNPVILPILRAGLGMVDGFLSLIPTASVGHIGLYRDEETLKPCNYYFKIPKNSQDRQFFVCDPMLATGGSTVEAITQLKKVGISKFIFVCLIAAPEGLEKVTTAHPDLTIYAAHLDQELNSKSYIVPGLGDAGDRLFGTL